MNLRKLTFTLPILAALMVVAFGCKKDEVVDTRVNVGGFVYNAVDNTVIEGVEVTYFVNDAVKTSTTDATGAFTATKLISGKHQFRFSKEGFGTEYAYLTADYLFYDDAPVVKDGGNVYIQAYLNAVLYPLTAGIKGSLHVTYDGLNGAPQQGTQLYVLVNGPNKSVYGPFAVADADGSFSITGLPAGAYINSVVALVPDATGYSNSNFSVDFDDNVGGGGVLLLPGMIDLSNIDGTLISYNSRFILSSNFAGDNQYVDASLNPLTVTFTEPIKAGGAFKIEMTNGSSTITVDNYAISGNVLTITPYAPLAPGTTTVTITDLYTTTNVSITGLTLSAKVKNPSFYVTGSSLYVNTVGTIYWPTGVAAGENYTATVTFNKAIDAARMNFVTVSSVNNNFSATAAGNVLTIEIPANELTAGETITIAGSVYDMDNNSTNLGTLGRTLQFETALPVIALVSKFEVDTTAFHTTVGVLTNKALDTVVNFSQVNYDLQWSKVKGMDNYQVEVYNSKTNTWGYRASVASVWNNTLGDDQTAKYSPNLTTIGGGMVIEGQPGGVMQNGTSIRFRVRAVSDATANPKVMGEWTELSHAKWFKDSNKPKYTGLSATLDNTAVTLNNSGAAATKTVKLHVSTTGTGGDMIGSTGSVITSSIPANVSSITLNKGVNGQLEITVVVKANSSAVGNTFQLKGISDSSNNTNPSTVTVTLP